MIGQCPDPRGAMRSGQDAWTWSGVLLVAISRSASGEETLAQSA
jgi:hypothetical protein